MVMEICQKNHDAFSRLHKPKLDYRRIFGRRRFARRTEPKGDIKVKKSPRNEEKKRKPESHSSGSDGLKKSRISEYFEYSLRVDGYEDLGAISKGSFGVVYRVRDDKTGEILAVKEELDGLCPTTLMEIDLLKSLGHHPSIVGFKRVLADEYAGVYVVMEYMEFDLKRYIAFKKEGLGIREVKRLMKQLLEGVKFLHENGVMHRDLKPSNLLVNKEGELKICDFGLSTRTLDSDSSRVGTLWYRAPEQLLGAKKMHWGAVDMWAVGCIMAELVLKKVLFAGESESDQFLEISRILGTPDEDQPCYLLLKACESAESKLTEDGFHLLKRLLRYDPDERITAEEALNHVWFEELSS